MTLASRLNAMEAEIRALRGKVEELSQWKASVEDALAAEEVDEEHTTTLDGERVNARERDQNESLG
jgi:TolA-binding protein